MVPVADLPAVAILRFATGNGGRLAVWRDGRMLAPKAGPSLGALAAGTVDEMRAWFETVSGDEIDPPDDFALRPGDEVTIAIDGLGTLRNSVGATGPVER